jgi:hypothetical protein
MNNNMNSHGRILNINGVEVTITDMEYDGFNGRISKVFDISFNVMVNDKEFVIQFSNHSIENQTQLIPAEFKGSGEAYRQFLQAVASSPEYQTSTNTEQVANEMIGAIAQSVYYDVRSHSPDQDEE